MMNKNTTKKKDKKTWYIHDSYRALKWVYAKDEKEAIELYLREIVIEPAKDDFLSPNYKESI